MTTELPKSPTGPDQHYLAKMAGEDVELPDEPIGPEQHYLAKIAGEKVELPKKPVGPVQHYLAKIIENGDDKEKNLLTFDALSTQTSNGVTSTFDGSKLVLDGKTTASGNIITPISLELSLPAGIYTWSFTTLDGSSSGSGSFAIYLRSAASTSGSEIANRTNSSLNAPISFTLSGETKLFFQIFCNAADKIFDNLTLGVQITEVKYKPYEK